MIHTWKQINSQQVGATGSRGAHGEKNTNTDSPESWHIVPRPHGNETTEGVRAWEGGRSGHLWDSGLFRLTLEIDALIWHDSGTGAPSGLDSGMGAHSELGSGMEVAEGSNEGRREGGREGGRRGSAGIVLYGPQAIAPPAPAGGGGIQEALDTRKHWA